MRGGARRFPARLSVGGAVRQRSGPLLRGLGRHGEESLLHVVPQRPPLGEPAVHLGEGQPRLLGQPVCSRTEVRGQEKASSGNLRLSLRDLEELIRNMAAGPERDRPAAPRGGD